MAKKASSGTAKKTPSKPRKTRRSKAAQEPRPWRRLGRWALYAVAGWFGLTLLAVTAFAIFNPPVTPYILSERARLGEVDRRWVDIEEIAPVMVRSVVAAEDANFCLHWGFDMRAIRFALEEGGQRGASTISQQVVKNVYLWHGRSWARKALEALTTPVLELVWTKRRVLEVYLNVAEFGEGVFGIEAAARQAFGVSAAKLSPQQAALLATVLPNPKDRSAVRPTERQLARAKVIASGADTIRVDGRAACFES